MSLLPLTCQSCGRTVEIPFGQRHARKNCSRRCQADSKRTAAWAFVHQPDIEHEQQLQLAGLLITPFTPQPAGLTRPQSEEVADIQRRLTALHRLGRLPEGDVCWVYPSGRKGPTPVADQTEAWIEHKLQTRQCFSLRVPLPVAEFA